MSWLFSIIIKSIIVVGLVWWLEPASLTRFLVPFEPIAKNGVVLITGTSSGIGYDAMLELCGKGYYVLACERKLNEISESEENERKCESKKYVRKFIMDVTARDFPQLAIEEALKFAKEKGVSFVGVVNNAGISNDLPFALAPEKMHHDVFNVNYFAVTRVIQAAIPHLIKTRGRIVTVSSIAGRVSAPGQAIYSASKHALEGFHDSLRRELMPLGVSVSLINPGCVASKIFKYVLGGEEDPSSKVSEKDKALWKWIFTKRINDLTICHRYAMQPRQSTSVDIAHALESRFPRSRYFPGNFAILPARFLVLVQYVFPDKLADVIIVNA